MGMTVSKDPDWLTQAQIFNFLKNMEDWNGSDFFLDRIESVAYRIRTLTKTYRVWVRTVSMKKIMLDRNGTDRREKIRFVYTEI